ncbi:MAG: dual specificity protein phosphatase family protein [Bdellovibrionales bacterium]|nr:dual specificity protein phosphatase family protein [Bdellovibrionales bacterium]
MRTDEITEIAEGLFITDSTSGQSLDLSDKGFDAVLCLDRRRYQNPHPDRKVTCVLAALPERNCQASHFDTAVGMLKRLVKEHGKVVVHCTHGQNRSVAVVAAYLVDTGMDPEEALDFVGKRRGARKLIDSSFEDLVRARNH